MSLMRAFTTRRNKGEDIPFAGSLGRAASVKAARGIRRSQISSPVALLSSTNSLSYEAPDIAGTTPIQCRKPSTSMSSTEASHHSADESDTSTLSIDSNTDASSVEQSLPISPEPEPNHLSCYFKPNVQTDGHADSPPSSPDLSSDAPQIPHRVKSHSKKAHERVHRSRSIRRMMSPPLSLMRSDADETFAEPVEVPKDSPFSSELRQLDEAAEEIEHTVRDAEMRADLAVMTALGLGHFSADDYLGEIHSLLYDDYLIDAPVWI